MKVHFKFAVGLVFAVFLSACSNDTEDKQGKATDKTVTAESVMQKQQDKKAENSKPQVLRATVKEGIDYEVLAGKDASSEPVVYEFFSYTCPHCYNLEPAMVEWKTNFKPKEVRFEQIPVYMEKVGYLTYGYYAAEELGVKDKIHPLIFSEWHEKKNYIRKKDDLIPFFQKVGISADKFEKAYQSEQVSQKVQRAQRLVEEFSILSFPQLILNEKYKVISYKNLEELLGSFVLNNTQ
jgi:thiol:disulfide interchange protein DsbA